MKKSVFLIIGLLLLGVKISSGTVYSVGLDKNQYSSDFMIGNVVVSIIFVESDGTIDPNIENWSPNRQSQVLSQIMSGLDWWTKQNPKSPLTFIYDTKTLTTGYEPIIHPYYDEALWIPEVMAKLGYTGSRFTSTRNYVNALRSQYNADWGFVIFVVDSQVDTDGKFADGYFAYSYLGGPFTVLTYDNNGYGISNMDVVVAHETGHIFNALDEYAGASSPNAYSPGYFPTINGNHAYSPTANSPNSIMRGGIRWGLDDWAKQMIGWRDANGNNHDDILDQKPYLTIAPQQTSSQSESDFSGQAKVRVLPRQNNLNSYGFTVDSIAKVEYRLQSGEWKQADPVVGRYGDAEVTFKINIPNSQTPGSQTIISASDLDVRVTTTFSGYVGTTASPSSSGTLANVHPYPNPFKPNAGQGKSEITFTNLSAGTKVQIFTSAGEPVFEKISDGPTLDWTSAKEAASGVYYFLVTDDQGGKKKGKLAIIR